MSSSAAARQTFAGEYLDLHWDCHCHAIPAVYFGVWLCPITRTPHADNDRADDALRPGH